MSKGQLIVLEGVEGSGKTTLLGNVQKALNAKYNKKVVLLKRPQTYRKEVLNAKTELGSFYWLLKDFIEGDNVVKHYLEQDFIVLIDRYIYSMMAYQGERYQIKKEEIESFFFEECGLSRPDHLIFLDEDFDVCQHRLNEKIKDKFEGDLELQWDVYLKYKKTLHPMGKVINCRGKNLGVLVREFLTLINS